MGLGPRNHQCQDSVAEKEELAFLYFLSERKANVMLRLVASPNSDDELSSIAHRLTKTPVCGSSVIAGGKSLAGKSKIIHNVTLYQPGCYWAR